jgi:hypothetical protein
MSLHFLKCQLRVCAGLLVGIAAPCAPRQAPAQDQATQDPAGRFETSRSSRAGAAKQKPAPADSSKTGATPASKTLVIQGDQHWVDTGVDLAAGDKVTVTASGTLQLTEATETNGPEGHSRGWKDLIRALPLNDAGRGALIGRVGSDAAAQPFVIGAKREFIAPANGRLFVGLNIASNEDAQGTYSVKIQATANAARAAGLQPGRTVTPAEIPGLAPAIFEKIPRRVADNKGNAGDMVNFLIIGSEDKVRQTFDTAGWVTVDRTDRDAVLHGILATISKEAYVQLPMSQLYLFDRPQDFGYAHAEPFKVVASRHHLRLWKAPFGVGGQTLWVGAGTHDIGFDRDQRNNGITHKIDPDIDLERDYIRDTLRESGMVAALTYMTPPNPVKEEKTATGASFHSNGQVLVLQLSGSSTDSSAAFADLFCSVLDQEHPDAGFWGDCGQYLAGAVEHRVALATIPTTYRLVVVPGVLSSCASSTPAFQEGRAYLHDKFGLSAELLPVPNDSSEANGALIAKYLKEQSAKDSRKFILLGYSKGAPDIQLALASDPNAAATVAAFITVAGAVGGSPIADSLPAQADKWIQLFHFGSCEGNLTSAFHSLRRDERKAFLADHPDPVVPTYSLAAVSDKPVTSRMLLENWTLLNVFDPQHDSQVVKDDAIVPGARFLGSARADHFAVALPFEDLKDAQIQKMVDKNHYPRTALLEALVRFVIQDLQSAK